MPRHPSGRPETLSWLEMVPRGERCDSMQSVCGRFEILSHWDRAAADSLGLVATYELRGRFVKSRPVFATFAAAAQAAQEHT